MKSSKFGQLVIYVGFLLIVAGALGIVGGIYQSFSTLRFNESAGIGAVGVGLWLAILSSGIALIGIPFAIVGLVMVTKKKSED